MTGSTAEQFELYKQKVQEVTQVLPQSANTLVSGTVLHRQCQLWFESNVRDLATAKQALKLLARAVVYLAQFAELEMKASSTYHPPKPYHFSDLLRETMR